MRVGSLFTGIGGLDLAVKMAVPSAEPLWFAESDPYCRAVLARHWPGVRCYEDVRLIDASTPRPDLICGGFPCQPVSLAGKRLGKDDPRWLWPEFARILGALRPDAVFIENVPGLRTAGLRDVLADLARLGFDAEWDYFTAAETGAPHIRRRLFLFAYTDGFARWIQPRRLGWESGSGAPVASEHGEARDAADAYGPRELQPQGFVANEWRWARNGDRWTPVPPVPGVDDGTPDRLDRERVCGNAVVPHQAALAFGELASRALRLYPRGYPAGEPVAAPGLSGVTPPRAAVPLPIAERRPTSVAPPPVGRWG